MANIVLILGGARSGKSRFAQQLAARRPASEVLFVATAEARDDEMARRIEIHRRDRPAEWTTIEEPLCVAKAVAAASGRYRTVIVDCLTLLVSNVLMRLGESPQPDIAERELQCEVEGLIEACRGRSGCVIVVSSEVGMGIVPDNPLSRVYRDALGRANQVIAEHAAAVYLMIAGLPVNVRALASNIDDVMGAVSA